VNGVKVVIPPLRERPEDIPLLVDHFSKQLPSQKRFTTQALAALGEYDWPGNVRELHFAVERAGLLAEGEMIDVDDLPPEIVEKTGRVSVSIPSSAPNVPAPQASGSSDNGHADDDDVGPGYVRVKAALEKAKWRREKAAEILGVSPRTLYRWIKRLGL
jgi:DNA-binding NtrC family response regulator